MEKYKPLVSILIPAYNAEKYISQALDSVLDQTYSNIEIIVINDGSADKTSAIAQSYKSRGIQVYDINNSGASAARNYAYHQSKGDFIKFFDADDLLSPDHIKLQVEKLNNRNDCVASSEWVRFYEEPNKAIFRRDGVLQDLPPIEWLIKAWVIAEPMTQPGMFLIPRNILEQAGLWNETLSLIDDFEFFTRIFLYSKEIKFTSGAKLYYRSGINSSLSGLRSLKGAKSAFLSIEMATSYLLQAENTDNTREVCAAIWQNYVYSFYPHFSDLTKKAEMKVKMLGGSKVSFPCGPTLNKISRLIGWKKARQLQLFLYALGYKPSPPYQLR